MFERAILHKLDEVLSAQGEVKANVADVAARVEVLEKAQAHKTDLRATIVSGVVSVIVAVATGLASCSQSGCQPAPVQHPSPDESAWVRKSVVLIKGVSATAGVYSATGWFLRGDLVVTAGHACSDDALIVGVTYDETKVVLVPVLDHDDDASTTGDDVCFLRPLQYEHPTHLDLAAVPPRFGEHLWTVGYQYGEVLVPGDGFAGEPALSVPAYQGTDIVSVPGNSGGPVLNDAGYVVGIVSRGLFPVELAVSLDTLRADLALLER